MQNMTDALESRSDGRFLLLWTGDFHDPGCGRRCVTFSSFNPALFPSPAMLLLDRAVLSRIDIDTS